MITAVIVEKTYSPENNLSQTARKLEDRLNRKESYIYGLLNDAATFKQIKGLADNHGAAINFLNKNTLEKSIWLVTLKRGQVSFWSGAKVIPNNLEKFKDGCSFIKAANGYYEVIKRSDGDFSAVFFIPVKSDYEFQNKYLQNIFSSDLTGDRNIDIADFTDKGIFAIHDINGVYLFSVKLIGNGVNNRFFYFELGIWLLALGSLFVLVHAMITYLANKGMVYLSILALALFIVGLRFLNLHYGWPSVAQPLNLFNPQLYGSSYVYPSLGDFCINILAIFWFVSYCYSLRNKLIKTPPSKLQSYGILTFCVITLLVTSVSFLKLFFGLVVNSKISFDVNNVLNLTGYSMIGVLMLCFSFSAFVLLTEIFLTICFSLNIRLRTQAYVFAIGMLLATGLTYWLHNFTFFYIFWGGLVFIRGYCYLYKDRRLTSTSFIAIILVCAIISSIKLNQFERFKEEQTRKAFIQRLEVPDDATADTIFKSIEQKIITAPTLVAYFKTRQYTDHYLTTRLQKQFFDRYLSKYEFKVHEFDAQDKPISADTSYTLSVFKDMVLYSSFQVSRYFYRENESFGFQSYFAILPVIDNGTTLGTIVIELKARPFFTDGTFPELLIDKSIKPENEYKDYSYAFYTDGKLIGQSGNYVYSVFNNEFNSPVKKYTRYVNSGTRPGLFDSFTKYSHLLYRPSNRNLIVVTREINSVSAIVTALTFFFVVFLAFAAVILLVRLLWIKIKIFNINNNRINWSINLNFDKILYKTRIQFSMIFAVVITLILVGVITFVSISTQYQAQQDRTIRTKITHITGILERGPINQYTHGITEEGRLTFDKIAENYSADITLYDLQGIPLISTQPKIYESGLLAPRMNGRAFIALKDKQKSEFVNAERIGGLAYKAAYAPLRNDKHEIIAYLQLPYFANAADYNERIGSLLNIMINLYALVFIAIGLFAVFIARQITAPLNFIQYNLSKTIYGKKNEPIIWQRDDEIGALVKEYNNMIAALENSAQKLAQSERETAWREMAKQVAHEIKNPLTPLKLGLQLLDKSWRDKDPKFDQKFERFSKSFVEQIESLSNIASEFSAFAKMPDTRIERINLFDMLGQAVTIFKQMDNVVIDMNAPASPFFVAADRDQLLRCFNNLLKNAIEATPPERSCMININFLVTSKNVLLTIKDNGNGIPENMREKIFEPNFTTKSSGTGLGLAFVKNSIENANGKIWFETNIGVGTTFYLNFPTETLDA
ncbi:hypothetical protein A0256_04270 [Mucilaginibacter sp. PAMC 26640]|nr:hypothetical protein A0256_04270 [Mucilaginibacter sp. PAMC 26640]